MFLFNNRQQRLWHTSGFTKPPTQTRSPTKLKPLVSVSPTAESVSPTRSPIFKFSQIVISWRVAQVKEGILCGSSVIIMCLLAINDLPSEQSLQFTVKKEKKTMLKFPACRPGTKIGTSNCFQPQRLMNQRWPRVPDGRGHSPNGFSWAFPILPQTKTLCSFLLVERAKKQFPSYSIKMEEVLKVQQKEKTHTLCLCCVCVWLQMMNRAVTSRYTQDVCN